MNKLYGLLVDSPDSGELYYRNTSQKHVDTKETRILIPNTTDKAYLQFCANQLCRLCNEVFPDKLAELDAENSYAYPTTALAGKTTLATGLPAGVTVTVFDQKVAYPFVTKKTAYTYDGVDTLTFGNKQLPWNDGTGMFQYQDFNIAFSGVAAGVFTGNLELARKPERSILTLSEAIKSQANSEWDPDFEPYRDATLLTHRVAAFTLNTLKGVLE